MSFIYSVLGFLLAIGVLVAVHEFGHFWVARKLGVKVLRFSIGFGKPLWKKVHGDDQIEYVVAAIPLGGYVKMLGEGDPEAPLDPSEKHRSFDAQPVWKRSLIVLAGPGINFLFAAILFLILGLNSFQGLTPTLGDIPEQSVLASTGVRSGAELVSIDERNYRFFRQHDLYVFNKVLKGEEIRLKVRQDGALKDVRLETTDVPIYNFSPATIARTLGLVPVTPEITTQISRVVEGSAAHKAKLQVDDRITRVDGEKIESWTQLVGIISASPGKPLLLSIERNEVLLEVSVTPDTVTVDQKQLGRIGIGPRVEPYAESQLLTVDRSLSEALQYGAEQTWYMSVVTLRMLWKMLTLQVSHQNISGPITIADVAGQAIQISWDTYVFVLAAISISLGVMNLLPIPMLDGGHLLMYLVEIVAGQDVSQKAFAVGQRLGIVLLICLMSLAFYNDIFRLLN